MIFRKTLIEIISLATYSKIVSYRSYIILSKHNLYATQILYSSKHLYMIFLLFYVYRPQLCTMKNWPKNVRKT